MKKTAVLLLCILCFNSCIDEDSFRIRVDEDVFIYNNTGYEVHVEYDEYFAPKERIEVILLDSVGIDYKVKGLFMTHIYSNPNPRNTLTTTQFSDSITKFKIYHIEQGDSVFITQRFYDGVTFWKRDETTRSSAFIFSAKYITHTLTITNEMFEN